MNTDIYCYKFCGLYWQAMNLPGGFVWSRYKKLNTWTEWKLKQVFINQE